jgi:hypothetical protein
MHTFLLILPIMLGGLGVAVLGGLYEAVRLLRRGQRRDRDIELAVLGEPERQGVPKVSSMREQFAQLDAQLAEIGRRPFLNGGAVKLIEAVDRVESRLDEAALERAQLSQGQVAGREAAAEAAQQAALAAQLAAAADRRAQEAVDLAKQNHDELTERLNNNDEIGRTMLATLAEQHHIDLRPQLGGELTGSLHVRLSPEEPNA